ncbi:hypothetical protein [Streptomyces spectabilis]|uniref:Uncharacterized protein n=1 Tax=Streptomyces spectabilis TaxID=68270 RepID=A0A5P2WYV0_STRST|nr:hypothetical protein [Streptomyces spectabilis]MBB5108007.1 hypothetical protein [Streptomyces spectabilis]MCI3907891.1 hypothetical protein [Streptomyces spectabilis]QEV57351.1 hypothetical protein CP982_00175 [Streptomyces spectabilis]GGV53249.1 hypothetical protein GCM10010245_83960 [Streptomyces spectabilis]
MSVALALTVQDKDILRRAAYGAVSLMAAADAVAGKPHRAATHGCLALASATGPVGHVLAEKTRIRNLDGASAAALADQVLPALAAAVDLLDRQSPAEAAAYRSTVLIAVEAAARAHRGEPGPVAAAMARTIAAALGAG